MTRRQRRLSLIGAAGVVLALAVGLVLYAMRDSITFFYSPSDLLTQAPAEGQHVRIGGLVKEGSVKRGPGTRLTFTVTDTAHDVPVTYDRIPPDLFREGQGVIVEGTFLPDGTFRADSVLAKHD